MPTYRYCKLDLIFFMNVSFEPWRSLPSLKGITVMDHEKLKLPPEWVGIMVGSDLSKVAEEAANYNCDTVIGIMYLETGINKTARES